MCIYDTHRQDEQDTRDPAAGRYYLVIMAYVLPAFALLMLLVLLITWRQKLGQLRKDADGTSLAYLLMISSLAFLLCGRPVGRVMRLARPSVCPPICSSHCAGS